ncbi:MAG: radical SAM protein [Burkholderiales bacterium]|nr:radical SAM protein [Burkholderiales bacterium]
MRVLVLWPPAVPAYFNAGHHLGLWEVSAYLEREMPGLELRTLDAGVLNMTWTHLAQALMWQPDVLAVQTEFDTVHVLTPLFTYCRALSPATRIVVFGRASSITPRFFLRYGPDAVVSSGDWEAAILRYLQHLAGADEQVLSGLLLRQADGSIRDTGPGEYLPADDWAYPDPTRVPWDSYNAMYGDTSLRFSGLPARKELPIAMARGCPLGCAYCLVAAYQGRRERRRSVASVMAYVDRVREVYPFDYLATHAPTFTLKRDWVFEFARAVGAHPDGFSWKTCTTLHHLDEAMIVAFARSRCLRLSVGLETLDEQAQASLPRLKRSTESRLREVAGWCRREGIELNCLVMLGMPGQTPEGLARTVRVVEEVGARLRPTIYTPYENLRDEMDESAFEMQTRQLVAPGVNAAMDPRTLYRIQYGVAA